MRKTKLWAGLLMILLLMGMLGAGTAEWRETTKSGKVIQREWVDENGLAAMAPEGYAVETLSYNGTTVTEKYFDLEGNPVKIAGGYAGRMLTYGNKHRLEELYYLDEYGVKANCMEGYARLKIIYMSNGGVIQATYYDQNNNMVMVPSLGYAQVKSEYHGSSLTRTAYLDTAGNPVETALGYAVRIQSVNKSSRIIGERFEHADGSAATCLEGWASMKRELDSKNREVSLKYYDLAGNLTDRGLGYAYEVKKWENDQICVISRYDVNDQQIAMGEGYVSLKRQTNKSGQVIRETYLDAGGNAVALRDGVAARKYEYDKAGRLAKVTFEGPRGDIVENNSGYAGYQETLDADGFVASRVFLSRGGSAVNTSAGYSEIRYTYDAGHQISATEYYDANGLLVRSE